MGINWQDVSFLLAAKRLGASYERTLTIGHQSLFADAAGIERAHRDCGFVIDQAAAASLVASSLGYVDPVLRHLGADHLDSLDASDYEGSTVVQDLNQPLPEALRASYSLVLDGGSLEHVFNFPQALKNCMEAVELGGHLALITPCNNYFGHGFYQLSPELFYRALSTVNGFEMYAVLVRASHRWARWHAVADPADVGARVTLTSPWASLLYVLAERVEIVEPFAHQPQQSDYVTEWTDGTRAARHERFERLPAPVRRVAKLFGTTSGPDHIRPIDMAAVADGATRTRLQR